MRKLHLVIAMAALALCASSALAEDVWGGPPQGLTGYPDPDVSWDRGAPGSTYQHWTFPDPGLMGPQDFDNPYGPNPPSAQLEEPTNWEWVEVTGPDGETPVTGWHANRQDQGDSTIILHIPNTPDPNLVKYIFMQMTSTKAPRSVTPVGVGAGSPYSSGTWSTGLPQIQHENPPGSPTGWYTYNYGLSIQPNPESEDIVITMPYCGTIDQIVVDTICIPEPATLGLLSLGGLGVLARRRRLG